MPEGLNSEPLDWEGDKRGPTCRGAHRGSAAGQWEGAVAARGENCSVETAAVSLSRGSWI